MSDVMTPEPFEKIVSDIREIQKQIVMPHVLGRKHVQNCRLVEDRHVLLDFLPKKAVCAEVGVLFGDYTQDIFARTQPRKLHLLDQDIRFLQMAKSRLPQDEVRDRVHLHVGNSSEVLESFPDGYFDWIYVDADHTYEGVKKDLEVSRRKIKSGGIIVADDYIMVDHIKNEKYGVVQAINEFCCTYNFELLFYALQNQMFCNVVLREIPTGGARSWLRALRQTYFDSSLKFWSR